MESVFELLLKKYMSLFDTLEWGHPLEEDRLNDLWELFHILHYASFNPTSDKVLFKILDYYAE